MGVDDIRERVEEANALALQNLLSAQPTLVDVLPLQQVAGDMGRRLTHSGPPVTWTHMSGAQRGAVIAAALYEGWAKDAEEAEDLASSGAIGFIPNHELGGVGPMAGVISPSMHVFVVEDHLRGSRAYSSIEYDAFFGCYDEEAIEQLVQWNRVYYPTMQRAIREMKGLDLKRLMAQALTMGDELHSRQVASSALLAKALSPAIVRLSKREEAVMTIEELAGNELTFLPLSMAACKVSAMAADAIPFSTLVTAMSRNGTEFGIRVSSLGAQWFTAPAPNVESVYFPGYGPDDAGPDMGDSSITETVGLGAFAFAAAPAITGLVGGRYQQLIELSSEMAIITLGRNPNFGIPQLDFEGTPTGIDLRKVTQTGITPVIVTATAHSKPGHRIIGAGISRAPAECFLSALETWFLYYMP